MMPVNIPKKLLEPYNPIETEPRIYKVWEESGFFNPDTCIEKGVTEETAEAFTIMMPPPNVTGVLHMGHALMISWQDTITRYNRMQGKKTLWLPGTDHAAIATQSKVEKEIKKTEGKSRHDLGREEMLSRIEAFAKASHDTIVSQVKALGSSCDWSREAFTLDETRNIAVKTIFKKMYNDGLIYRGTRVVNWDPKGQTTIADDEIVYMERKSKLYTFKYSKDFPISISTTRPETKVGDTAVAVHPEDPRYSAFIGQEYDTVFCGVPIHIKIIADESVEKEFGTGALGVTPAHSMIDETIAKKHGLESKQVINEYAKMMVGDERILNKKTTEAREVIVSWLQDEGLLEKEEEVTQNVATAERTEGIIEPLPKLQWFIDVNKEFTLPYSDINGIKSGDKTTLKEIMRKAVSGGQIEIMPDYFDKTYFHWIDDLQDWCISRQIWYGHRIPVWYKELEVYCGVEDPIGDGWTQDEDTLDTWFSSGLWTFSTLGWPNETKDFKTYHPTTLIQPGTEIIFFWVARMILMTGYALGTIPFETVLLNGIVRDSQGRKFSKSLGNGGDPIEVANRFGADAIRFYFCSTATPGTDSKLYEDKIKGYKNFGNKIWNITRFVMQYTNVYLIAKPETLTDADTTILQESSLFIEDITKEIDNYHLHLAAEKIYQYVWHYFADILIEESKPILSGNDDTARTSRAWLLQEILRRSIKLLHPFMPFITEELWSLIPHEEKELLIVTPWNSSKTQKQ